MHDAVVEKRGTHADVAQRGSLEHPAKAVRRTGRLRQVIRPQRTAHSQVLVIRIGIDGKRRIARHADGLVGEVREQPRTAVEAGALIVAGGAIPGLWVAENGQGLRLCG